MNPSFENKVAFIAGASGGINLAIAEAYGGLGRGWSSSAAIPNGLRRRR